MIGFSKVFVDTAPFIYFIEKDTTIRNTTKR